MSSSTPAVAIRAAESNNRSVAVHRHLRSEHFALWIGLIYFCAMSVGHPGFFSASHGLMLLVAMVPLLLLTTGQALVLIGGGIDLSIMALTGFVSVVGASAMNVQNGWLGHSQWVSSMTILVMLVSGLVVGWMNGFAVTRLRMPASLVTLSTMLLCNAFASRISHSRSMVALPASFTESMRDIVIGGTATMLIIVLFHIGLRRTLSGRWLYVSGQNPLAASTAGVPVDAVRRRAFMAAGFCAAVAAIFVTANGRSGLPIQGQEMLLDVLTAALLGGATLRGGRGKLAWITCAVAFVVLLNDLLKLLNIAPPFVMITKASLLGIAVVIDSLRNPSS
jgi:ribose/xylose/arabinose/galactoside ABC-type transport system permease subunit